MHKCVICSLLSEATLHIKKGLFILKIRQLPRVFFVIAILIFLGTYPWKFGEVTESDAANTGESVTVQQERASTADDSDKKESVSNTRDSIPAETGEQPGEDAEYEEFVDEWHRNRIEILQEDQGWLRLTGLYWLNEGEQMFGSGSRAPVQFPEGSIPEYAGIFELRSDTVFIQVAGNIDIRNDHGHQISEDTIYTPDERMTLHYRELTWFVMKRDDKLGIRLYDDNSPHLEHFDGIERFEIDKEWRIEADFSPHEQGSTMQIENVLGQFIEWDVAGTLSFRVDGQDISMLALGTGDRLFVPFADATTGEETYSAGRYVYIDRPEPGESAVIDFNLSYNPPCAINPYTTCPLPPSENRLDIAIRAGEKDYDMYEE